MSVLSTLSSLTRPVAGIATVPLKVAGRVAGSVHGLLPGGATKPESPVATRAPAKPAATAAKAQGDPVAPAAKAVSTAAPIKKPAPKKPAPKKPAPAEAAAPKPTPAPEPAPVTDIDAAAESLEVDVTPADVVANIGTQLKPSDDDA